MVGVSSRRGVYRRIGAAFAALAVLATGSPGRTQQGQPTGVPNVIIRDGDIGGRRLAIVASDWFYCYPPTRELILVPRGYVTDFASIPAAFRGLIDPYGFNIEGALVHDWLYAVGQPGERAKADAIIRYALMEQHVDVVRRNAVYRAVRVGGGEAYGKAAEWDRRFGDPQSGQRLPKSPYRRPATAVVGLIDGTCGSLDKPEVLASLHRTYKSSDWPRAD
jgi:hypothetical protein